MLQFGYAPTMMKRGLQSELSRASGLNRIVIHYILTGKRPMSNKSARALSRVLGHIDDLNYWLGLSPSQIREKAEKWMERR